jgi:predicted Zn-dependent protease
MGDNRRYFGGTGDPYSRQGQGTGTGRFKLMLIIGLGMAAYQAFNFYTNTQTNPITGEEQRIQWTMEEEIALGLNSAPQMAQQYGGLYPDQRAQDHLDAVGKRLTANTIAAKAPYPYDFHLLADTKTVNAFALPGGQCFITAALYLKLKNEDQLAGIMGHEIGHVIERHGAQRMASQGFIQGLIQSVMIGSGGNGSAAQVANVIGQYSSLKYGRDQELQSDDLGVRIMIEAGYDPVNLIGVMDILEESSGGQGPPEFQSTHPSPENRRELIKKAIEKYKK